MRLFIIVFTTAIFTFLFGTILNKIEVIEKWGKQQGCTHLETYARPGWSRILKQHNYKVTHYLLERKLEE